MDATTNDWPVAICAQIVQCLSLSCACCLYLKPFLDSVESGLIRSDDIRRRGSEYTSGSSLTKKRVFSKDSLSRSKAASFKMNSTRKPEYFADVQGGEAADREDSESQHSRAHMIREIRTFAVETTS